MSGAVTVVTLVRGRRRHLEHLMQGLAWQTRRPDRLVIAYMQPRGHAGLPDPGCPVDAIHVFGEPMPLAAARNAGVRAALPGVVVCLDVDCIPSPGLIDAYAAALAHRRAVAFGEVRYLPPGVPEGAPDEASLDRAGRPHPSKPAFPATGIAPEPDPGQLWGLSFAMRRDVWLSVGGMDERFVGYGAEETDLARAMAEAGVPFLRTGGARAWHQHHDAVSPPLDRFEEIVANATRFRAKWGEWCMGYWLDQFEAMGLIARDGSRLTVRRRPTPAEMAEARAAPERRWS